MKLIALDLDGTLLNSEKVISAGNFAALTPFTKILLSIDMLAGRLEIFPLLMLFAPTTWRGR